MSTEKDSAKPFKVPAGAFAAPGVAARDLHVMMLPPNYGICYHDMQIHEITHATLRALRENKVRLKYLSLPGSDYLGKDLDAKERRGIVPLDTLISGVKSPGATKPTGLLLPVLRRLKVLELNIDFKHPGGPDLIRGPLSKSRLRTALQRMDQLESLSLGAPVYLVGDPGVWNLTDLLLWKKDDYPEQSSSDPDPGPGPGGLGAAQGLNGLMNILMSIPGFGNALNAANPPPQNPTTANAANAAQQIPPTSSNAAGGTIPVSNTPAGPPSNVFSQLVGGSIAAIDLHGNIASQPLGLFDLNSAANGEANESDGSAKKTNLPDDALTPKPWPKLQYLSLWNLPSSPEEISRLVKTVKDSLRTLKLFNIHFARPDAIIDDGYDMYLDVGFDGPPPPVGNAPPGQAMEETPSVTQGDDEDQDLPDLVDLVDQPALSGPSAPADNPATAGILTVSTVPTAPAAPGASTVLPTPANLFGPMPITQSNGLQPPAGSTGGSNQDAQPKDTADLWLSTIEMLAEELRLTSCDITIEEHDENYLWHKLSKQIVEMPSNPLGKMVARYLLEGDGMGFILFLANKLKEPREPRHFVGHALTEASEEDDEGESRRRDARIELMKQHKPRNIHICSNWQACPGKDYFKF